MRTTPINHLEAYGLYRMLLDKDINLSEYPIGTELNDHVANASGFHDVREYVRDVTEGQTGLRESLYAQAAEIAQARLFDFEEQPVLEHNPH